MSRRLYNYTKLVALSKQGWWRKISLDCELFQSVGLRPAYRLMFAPISISSRREVRVRVVFSSCRGSFATAPDSWKLRAKSRDTLS